MTASLRKNNFSLGDEAPGANKGMYETGTVLTHFNTFTVVLFTLSNYFILLYIVVYYTYI